MSGNHYYLLRTGATDAEGPLDEGALVLMREAGELAEEDHVCQEGWADWRTVGAVFGEASGALAEAARDEREASADQSPGPPGEANPVPNSTEAGPGYLERYLLEGEVVHLVVAQSKLMAKTAIPDSLAITDKRLLILRRGLIKTSVTAAHWHEVKDVKLESGLMSARLVIAMAGSVHRMDHLPKAAAIQAFNAAQQREKRALVIE